MRKVLIILVLFATLVSISGCKKKEPLEDITSQCALSFAKAYLINNFEYNPNTKYYISERLTGIDKSKSKTIQFPCYYFVYDMENILFTIGLYCSKKNDVGCITYPYNGHFVYAALVDKTTEFVLKEKNVFANKVKINNEIKLTRIKSVTINENVFSQETSLIIQDLLVELSNKKIKKLKNNEDDKFYIKSPIKDYTIVIEDDKNISINEKLIYPLFKNEEIIALYQFNADGSIACTLTVDELSIYSMAYQKSDKFVLVHGGDYPYLKTYCLYGDEALDAEILNEMFTDPIFIKAKDKINQILANLQPYEILIEIELEL